MPAKKLRRVGKVPKGYEKREAVFFSYSPPGSGYHHDVGDIAGQTSVAKKRQMMAAARQRYQQSLGRDGGISAYDTPARVPNARGTRRDGLRNSYEGTEDPNARDILAGRRKKGNRYYRTD